MDLATRLCPFLVIAIVITGQATEVVQTKHPPLWYRVYEYEYCWWQRLPDHLRSASSDLLPGPGLNRIKSGAH
ncbi:hypothetical protein V8C35DRAFT_292186 [Trichoderma chlorosporum]